LRNSCVASPVWTHDNATVTPSQTLADLTLCDNAALNAFMRVNI
jgi:succinylarginine dihydrolase